MNTGFGIGTFVGPFICELLFDTYGPAGSYVILSGIALNLMVCGALYRQAKHTPWRPRERSSISVTSTQQDREKDKSENWKLCSSNELEHRANWKAGHRKKTAGSAARVMLKRPEGEKSDGTNAGGTLMDSQKDRSLTIADVTLIEETDVELDIDDVIDLGQLEFRKRNNRQLQVNETIKDSGIKSGFLKEPKSTTRDDEVIGSPKAKDFLERSPSKNLKEGKQRTTQVIHQDLNTNGILGSDSTSSTETPFVQRTTQVIDQDSKTNGNLESDSTSSTETPFVQRTTQVIDQDSKTNGTLESDSTSSTETPFVQRTTQGIHQDPKTNGNLESDSSPETPFVQDPTFWLLNCTGFCFHCCVAMVSTFIPALAREEGIDSSGIIQIQFSIGVVDTCCMVPFGLLLDSQKLEQYRIFIFIAFLAFIGVFIALIGVAGDLLGVLAFAAVQAIFRESIYCQVYVLKD